MGTPHSNSHLSPSSSQDAIQTCGDAQVSKVWEVCLCCRGEACRRTQVAHRVLQVSMCNKMLDSTSCNEKDNCLYCKACYGRRHGPKGYGFGSGAGALNMDTGVQFGNTEFQDNKPVDTTFAAK